MADSESVDVVSVVAINSLSFSSMMLVSSGSGGCRTSVYEQLNTDGMIHRAEKLRTSIHTSASDSFTTLALYKCIYLLTYQCRSVSYSYTKWSYMIHASLRFDLLLRSTDFQAVAAVSHKCAIYVGLQATGSGG